MPNFEEHKESNNPEQKSMILKGIIEQQLIHEKNGEYMEAESCRLKALFEKKTLEESAVQDMDSRHAKQFNDLSCKFSELIQKSNAYWKHHIQNHQDEWGSHVAHLESRFKSNIEDLKIKLNEELPLKVKETYELINLRKMEEYTAKQKKFADAHKVQEKVKALYNKEHQQWISNRTQTINKAVFNLKNRQQKEKNLYEGRMQKQLQQKNYAWHSQKTSLIQRYNNELKEMKARHQRQLISFRGQFTTKGGCFSQKYKEIQLNLF